jgi:hypothetical protein
MSTKRNTQSGPVMNSNQASRQVQFSMTGISCEVQISGSQAFGILKLHEV